MPFYLGSCEKGGLIHYAHMLTVASGPRGLVPGLGMGYHHRPDSLGLSTSSHLVLSGYKMTGQKMTGSVPVLGS